MNIEAGRTEPGTIEEIKGPWHREIPDHKQVFVGELAEHGDWIVANIRTGSFWPIKAQKVMYCGEAFWILPVMKEFCPAVAMKVPAGKSRAVCEELHMRFVSNLSWVEDRGFMTDSIGGGNLPRPMGRDKQSGFSICDEFDLSYFPEPMSEGALLALALMREGRGLNHVAYAFLSFFRVIEVAIGGEERDVARAAGENILRTALQRGDQRVDSHLSDVRALSQRSLVELRAEPGGA
jgi:hypothetical protein